MAVDWTDFEVEAVVTDYFAMLLKELRGEKYSKTKHRHSLMRLLDNRSNGSVEFKHQNISAVMIELGYPYIEGYKPRWNFQALLVQAVKARLEVSRDFESVVRRAVDATPSPADLSDMTTRLEDPPDLTDGAGHEKQDREPGTFIVRSDVNYLERETRNRSLGRLGEKFAVEFERARLRNAGLERMAHQVEHVAVTIGDGLGYDVLSFEEDGSDRLIEVKTTGFGKQTPFFVSRNELRVSQARPEFHLYRVFAYRSRPRLYILGGPLDRVCRLEPSQFIASFAV